MYVGNMFIYVTQQTIYVIVVPPICCSKNPTTCTCFFFGMLHVITKTRFASSQCHNGIIQILMLGRMIMFELRHHRENTTHSQPSIRGCMTTW